MMEADIREHMDVVGSDGGRVGRVDAVRGDQIKLTRNDPDASNQHHLIPRSWIDEVDGDTIRLTCTEEEAKQRWIPAD